MNLTREQIDGLINIGYELHIYDKYGEYPGFKPNDREGWLASEIRRVIPGISEEDVEYLIS